MKKTLFMLFCLLCSIGAMAQKKTITGVVTDATGEAVIGASIVETGTTNGTVTDLDGNFTLSVANDGSIRVSFVGYQTQTLSVKGKSTFKIALKEDSEMLQEVVVTGYGGKQLRTKVTNSISKVKEETLKQGLYSNPAQALSGAVAGLSVSQTSGNPGAAPTLVLRGGTNFDGSGSPLILVDGQVRGSLSDINPADIESMEVLITRNLIFNQFRKSFNENAYKLTVLSAAMDYYDMEDELSAADLKEFIKRMVGGLPPRQQEVFKMSRDEHLTYKEIATRLNISEKTVERHINEAIKFLKKNIMLYLIFIF